MSQIRVTKQLTKPRILTLRDIMRREFANEEQLKNFVSLSLHSEPSQSLHRQAPFKFTTTTGAKLPKQQDTNRIV